MEKRFDLDKMLYLISIWYLLRNCVNVGSYAWTASGSDQPEFYLRIDKKVLHQLGS